MPFRFMASLGLASVLILPTACQSEDDGEGPEVEAQIDAAPSEFDGRLEPDVGPSVIDVGVEPDQMLSPDMQVDATPEAPDGEVADELDGGLPDASPDDATLDARVPDMGAQPDAMPPTFEGPREVIVHLFEWRWDAIADECEMVLGPGGYRAVQVSPPQEYGLIEGHPWWERYQPVSYQLAGRSGDADAFDDMVRRCADAGVEIMVDAVINHMAFSQGPGVAGTEFERYRYPGLYEDEHFHQCRRGIENWGDRFEIHHCELATLPDLATGHPHVRQQLTAYLQDLLDRGVAGFRVDAAKHMPAVDLAAIFDAVDGDPYVFQEVVDTHDGEVVTAEEYFGIGRITEFRYGLEITRVFTEGQLSWLSGFGEAWGMVPSEQAVVFIDNHDTQRGHGVGDPITHRVPDLYRVANVFMLAWPYGHPKVMSSYAIRGGDHGPPRDAEGATTRPPRGGDCSDGWICEHRWPDVMAMVRFRSATTGAPVSRWWSNGNDQIAFAREGRGYVIINREEAPTITRFFDTGLAPGRYCDVLADSCDVPIEVNGDGWAEITIGPLDAVALHVEAMAP
ncbi:MAG: alpha-amylase [Bradymonadia bacterium]